MAIDIAQRAEIDRIRRENQRELGAVASAECSTHLPTHHIFTALFKGDSGGEQAFQACLDSYDEVLSFANALAEALDIESVSDLIGRPVYALRSFGFNNDVIEGLELVSTGKRFTKTAWRRSKDPHAPSCLDIRFEDLRSEITRFERCAAEARSELYEAAQQFIDWSENRTRTEER